MNELNRLLPKLATLLEQTAMLLDQPLDYPQTLEQFNALLAHYSSLLKTPSGLLVPILLSKIDPEFTPNQLLRTKLPPDVENEFKTAVDPNALQKLDEMHKQNEEHLEITNDIRLELQQLLNNLENKQEKLEDLDQVLRFMSSGR